MSGVPRCPVCKAWLSTDRTIEEIFQTNSGRPAGRLSDAMATPDRWEYRLSCPGCFAVVSYDIAEISAERPRPRPSPPKVLCTGAVVTRVIERLRDAAREEIAGVIEGIVADAELRTLLRVPEVFVIARPGYGEWVRFAVDVFYRRGDALEGFVRVSAYAVGAMIVPAGTRARVLGVQEQSFKLLPSRGPSLLASPDLLAPADPLP